MTQILASILAAAWDVVTFLVVPVIVVEGLNPVDAIKRSGGLLRQTWGEQVVGAGGVGLIFGLLTFAMILLGVPLVIGAAALGAAFAVFIGGLLLVAIVGVNLVGGALASIYRAALYRYAVNGHVEAFFDDTVMEAAFKPKRA